MKTLKNIFLLIFIGSFFTSCSYHLYYPERVNAYGFDSSGQTKIILEPNFNKLGLHLGLAHSFSNHLFLAAGGQLNSNLYRKQFPGYKLFESSVYGKSNALATYISVGYFNKSESGKGYEIVPGFYFERNHVQYISTYNYEGDFSDNVWPSDNRFIHYYVPNVQTSYYLKREKCEWYFTTRLSYVFADSLSRKFVPDEVVFDRTIYSRNFLVEPGIQFSFTKMNAIRFFASTHLSTLKNDNPVNIPLFEGGIKFNIQFPLKKKDEPLL